MSVNKIETSTSCIGHFVYDGLYETLLGEYMGGVPHDGREEADKVIGKLYVETLTDALNDVFGDLDDDFSLTYERTYHPRYYNFETDSIIFTFEYTDTLRYWMLGYAATDKDAFADFLAEHYTSRSGFLSFTPNNWDDWFEGWRNNDSRCVSALIRFLIEQEITDYKTEHYWQCFNEDAINIICEQLTPWEWAERFSNGYVAVLKHDYDDVEDCTFYNAWLLDDNGNIVKQAKLYDEYDENFHCSAFAAWHYSFIIDDLTDRHAFCGYSSEPCDIPVIPEQNAA